MILNGEDKEYNAEIVKMRQLNAKVECQIKKYYEFRDLTAKEGFTVDMKNAKKDYEDQQEVIRKKLIEVYATKTLINICSMMCIGYRIWTRICVGFSKQYKETDTMVLY